MLSAQLIKTYAREVGFDLCGIAPAHPLPDAGQHFRAWLASGAQASLGYLERNLDKRFDPAALVPGAASVVVCAVGYKNLRSEGYPEGFAARIASYALSEDYHAVIGRMLREVAERLRDRYPDLRGRAFVDTAPIVEKRWAVEAGLGWIGRQSLLVTPRLGSFVLLGELVLTLPTDRYDTPFEGSRCGRCRNCVDSCPTGAIGADRTVDARRCIACHTIEQAGGDRRPPLDGWIFGCDRCQSCCPYNLKAPLHSHPAFTPRFDPLDYPPERWLAMSREEFDRTMGATPLTRCSIEGLRRNLSR